MKNTLPTPGGVRQPRGLVTLNGARVDGWLSWEVDSNNYYQADTFRVRYSLTAVAAKGGYDAAWFASQQQIEVQIFAGFPNDPVNYGASDLSSLIIGRVDDVCMPDFRTVELVGRDLTSVFIDTKSTNKYPNQTASQIAAQLAGEHGLAPAVSSTKTKVGRYYQIDHVRLQDDRTEWDLLTWLAREEQFAVFVKGRELHFQPLPQPTQDPYVFQWREDRDGAPSFNGVRIKPSRNLTLARDLKVIVRSWHGNSKKVFTATAEAKRTRNPVTRGAGRPVTPTQEIVRNIPGLTQEQAQARANQILREMSRHEMRLEIEGPADNVLSTTDVIQLTGSGTQFDQIYYPDSIVRSMDLESGYRWTIQAKNHSPDSDANL